jgi:hypothetical protein
MNCTKFILASIVCVNSLNPFKNFFCWVSTVSSIFIKLSQKFSGCKCLCSRPLFNNFNYEGLSTLAHLMWTLLSAALRNLVWSSRFRTQFQTRFYWLILRHSWQKQSFLVVGLNDFPFHIHFDCEFSYFDVVFVDDLLRYRFHLSLSVDTPGVNCAENVYCVTESGVLNTCKINVNFSLMCKW